jgi:hypothetical protein
MSMKAIVILPYDHMSITYDRINACLILLVYALFYAMFFFRCLTSGLRA